MHGHYVSDDRPTPQGTSLGEHNGLPVSMGAVIKSVRTRRIEFLGLTQTRWRTARVRSHLPVQLPPRIATPKAARAKNGWISLRLPVSLVRMSRTDSKRRELPPAWRCS